MQTKFAQSPEDASRPAALDAEQSSLSSYAPAPHEPCLTIKDASKPCWFIIHVWEGGRKWLGLNSRAISAESIKRIKATLAQENRLSEESPDPFAARFAGRGNHVWLPLNSEVFVETFKRLPALPVENDRRCGDLSLNEPSSVIFADGPENSLSISDLAAELDVTRRTVERALKDGLLIPTGHKGARARFSREYADRLKARAHEARLRGITQVIGVAAGTGPIVGAVQIKRARMSPQQRAQVTLWKLKHRRNPRSKMAVAPVKPRPVRILTSEEIAARARLAADRAKLAEVEKERKGEGKRTSIRITMSVNGLQNEPLSVDRALQSLKWMRLLMRAEVGPEAERIEKGVSRFRRSLIGWEIDDRALVALRDLIPDAAKLQRESAQIMVRTLTNMVAWCKRSRVLASNRIRGKAPLPS